MSQAAKAQEAARIRAKHAFERLKALIAGLESCFEADEPTSGTRQGVCMAAQEVAEYLAIIDATRER
jgi:hypothetical protein